VNDPAVAAHYLEHIGYYRLSGYALPFQKGGSGADRHDFKPGATFERILDRYNFDRKLRLAVMDAVERIEISIRSTMSNSISIRHGAHWYLKPNVFNAQFNHAQFIEEVKDQIGHTNHRRRDVYIEHYYSKYSTPSMPPSWMVMESISLGTISRAYKNLLPSEFNPICHKIGLPHHVLSSWMHSLSYIRNICAHHSRLWNRECSIKPIAANAYKADLTPNDRIYAQLVIMQILLQKIAPGNHWAQKLMDLLNEHPDVPLVSMGFPTDWSSRKVWGS
jgi:abortive infection bacteriophage resistance protein